MKSRKGDRRKKDVSANWRLLIVYYVYLFVTWGIFRFTVKFDDLTEEMIIKPLVWLLPLLLVFLNNKSRLRLFEGKILTAVGWGLGVGTIFMVANMLAGLVNGKDLVWSQSIVDFIGISLVTAIVEEIVFSGFILANILDWTKKVYMAILGSSILFVLIHVPIGLFLYRYGLSNMVSFLVLVMIVSLINNYIFYKTKNIVAPILSHWLWGIAVVIFR